MQPAHIVSSRIFIPKDLTADDLIATSIPQKKRDEPLLIFFHQALREMLHEELQAVRGRDCSFLRCSFNRDWPKKEAGEFLTGEGCDGNLAVYLYILTRDPSIVRSATIIQRSQQPPLVVYCTRVPGQYLLDIDSVQCSFGVDRVLVGSRFNG